MIKGVIFDMDGVLVDNRDAHYQAFEIFCDRYGAAGWRDKLATVFGMGNRDIMSLLLPPAVIAEHGFDALADEKETIYRQIYTPVPVPGLEALLQRLVARGIKCAVGSSGCSANVAFVLEGCGIANYFDLSVTGDMVTQCKPDPEIYCTASQRLDLSPDVCLVFEDARAGIESARRAGIHTVVALATTLSPDALRETDADKIITDFRELDDAALDSLIQQ